MGDPSDSCTGTGICPLKPSPAAATTTIHYLLLLLLLLPLLLTTRVHASRLAATRASRTPCDESRVARTRRCRIRCVSVTTPLLRPAFPFRKGCDCETEWAAAAAVVVMTQMIGCSRPSGEKNGGWLPNS